MLEQEPWYRSRSDYHPFCLFPSRRLADTIPLTPTGETGTNSRTGLPPRVILLAFRYRSLHNPIYGQYNMHLKVSQAPETDAQLAPAE